MPTWTTDAHGAVETIPDVHVPPVDDLLLVYLGQSSGSRAPGGDAAPRRRRRARPLGPPRRLRLIR